MVRSLIKLNDLALMRETYSSVDHQHHQYIDDDPLAVTRRWNSSKQALASPFERVRPSWELTHMEGNHHCHAKNNEDILWWWWQWPIDHNKKDECAAHTVSIRLDLSQHALVQQPLLQVTVERAGLWKFLFNVFQQRLLQGHGWTGVSLWLSLFLARVKL